MSGKNWSQLLNEALAVCSIGHIPHDKTISKQTFGFGPEALNIVGDENRRRLDQVLDQLLDSSIGESLSKQKMISLIVPILHEKKIKGETFDKAGGELFKKNLEALPVVEHKVLRDIYGASIANSQKPVTLACFTIYDWARHKSIITGLGDKDDSWVWHDEKHGLLAECKVLARDTQKAMELADALFSRLELIIKFMIGHRTDRFDVGVLNHRGSKISRSYVFTEKNISSNHAVKGAIESIPLDDNYFKNPSPPFAKLLGILEKQSTAFQKKILRSAEWTGQAMSDPNPASAFIKAATALEVLFSANEKGVITPSIMAQISESCAHILGDTAESSVEMEKTVKMLYGTRSAVVHFGKDEVSQQDLNTFIFISRSVVMALLSKPEFSAVDSIEKLYEMLRLRKYSGAMVGGRVATTSVGATKGK